MKFDIMKKTDCHVPALVYKGQTLKEAEENEHRTGDGEIFIKTYISICFVASSIVSLSFVS